MSKLIKFHKNLAKKKKKKKKEGLSRFHLSNTVEIIFTGKGKAFKQSFDFLYMLLKFKIIWTKKN